jgi:hypothetical protein
MTEKEIADRIDTILAKSIGSTTMGSDLLKLRNELDPPKSKPGWYAVHVLDIAGERWMVGYFNGHALYRNKEAVDMELPLVGSQYIHEYRRILGPWQMAIDRPHTDVWPIEPLKRKIAARASLVWHFFDSDGACFSQITAKHGSITYAEAKRMETEDGT